MTIKDWKYFKGDAVALLAIMTGPVNIGIGVGIWQMHVYTGQGPFGLDYSLFWLAIYLICLIYVRSEYTNIQNIIEYERLVNIGKPAKGRFQE